MNCFITFTTLLAVGCVFGEEQKQEKEVQTIEKNDHQISKDIFPKPIGVVFLLRLISKPKSESSETSNEILDKEKQNLTIELSPVLLVLTPKGSSSEEKELDLTSHSRKKRTLKKNKSYGSGGGGCTTCGCNTCGGGGGGGTNSGSWSSSSSSSGSYSNS